MQRLLIALALLVCGCTPTADPLVITEAAPPETAPPDADATATSEPAESADDPLLGFGFRGRPIHPLAVSRMISWGPASKDGPRVVDLETQPLVDEAVELDGARVSFDDDEPGWTLTTCTIACAPAS